MRESVDTRPSLPQLWEAGPGYEANLLAAVIVVLQFLLSVTGLLYSCINCHCKPTLQQRMTVCIMNMINEVNF